MSQDTHGFSVSADALHHATASGFAFAGQATESAAPAAVAPDGKPAASGGGEMQQMILFIGVMFIMMYLVVLRPQKREKKERQQRLDGMKKGDKVISIGGIHGKITDVDHTQGIVSVEVAPKITLKFSKAAIQAVTPKGEDKEAPKQDSDSVKAE